MLPNDSEGFTIVELLVVISILAILTTIGIVQYHGINSKARDSARRADLYEIATALEVNKIPDGYISLQTNQFSSFQWADPGGNSYCIASGNPADPEAALPWGNSCPSGFTIVAPGVPAGTFTIWKVCTFLENPGSGNPNVYCKTSRQ